ncbi:MAG: KH domain-containing protein [Coriobacteriia bacterium]|nr:KH domain-containing protein [Coriobacteriia bacterium]
MVKKTQETDNLDELESVEEVEEGAEVEDGAAEVSGEETEVVDAGEEAVEEVAEEAAVEADGAGSAARAGGERPEITDEELDRIADTAIETLRELLVFFGAQDNVIDEYEGDEGELILDVVGDNLAVLIGRYGKTLDALQYLVASLVNKKIGYRYPIAVDVEGYRNRRRRKLENLAKSAAARCIRSGKEVRLRPMTPYERRAIHIILRDETRVETYSEGADPQRQVIVKPKES